MRIASAATLTAGWLAAAWLLWRTQVPGGLALPEIDAADFVAPDELRRRQRHSTFLRWNALAALGVQLGALLLLARRAPAGRGPALARAVELASLVVVVAALARLPFGLAAHWWQRRHGIATQGYGGWLLDLLPGLASTLVVAAIAALLAVAFARRLGRRWWLAGAPAVALLGAVTILAQPLLTPRLERVRDAALVARVETLAARQRLEPPRVERQRTRDRTRAINALALGVGPTTRVILWDTALGLPRRELDFLVAHELAHVSRSHLWKGAAWFALLALPGIWVVARTTDLREPRQLPRAALVAALVALAASPLANSVSRRYEAEADWVAVETTRDAAAARALLERLSAVALRDPETPWWTQQLFGTHPPLVERLALIRALRGD